MRSHRLVDPLTMETDRSRRMQRSLAIGKQYKQGVPVDVIAERFECSIHTVLRIARTLGLPKRPRTNDPQRHKKIVAYQGSIPAKEIAEQCKCSIALVSKVEHANGIKRYGPRPHTK